MKTSHFQPCKVLIIVPQPAADLLLERVVELGLIAHAVEVLHSDAKQMSTAAAPLPAGLHGQIAAEVGFLMQVAVDGEKGENRSIRSVPWNSNSAPNWNSHGFATPSS